MADPKLVKQGEDRRKTILKYLVNYQAEHGFAPTSREIAKAVGIAGPTAWGHVTALQDDGLIEIHRGVARGIKVTAKGRRAAR